MKQEIKLSSENKKKYQIVYNNVRACLREGGGPHRGEVTRLGMVKKKLSFTCNLTTPPSRGTISQDYWMLAKHVNKKNAGKPRFFVINALLHSLAASVSAVAFYCYL